MKDTLDHSRQHQLDWFLNTDELLNSIPGSYLGYLSTQNCLKCWWRLLISRLNHDRTFLSWFLLLPESIKFAFDITSMPHSKMKIPSGKYFHWNWFLFLISVNNFHWISARKREHSFLRFWERQATFRHVWQS